MQIFYILIIWWDIFLEEISSQNILIFISKNKGVQEHARDACLACLALVWAQLGLIRAIAGITITAIFLSTFILFSLKKTFKSITYFVRPSPTPLPPTQKIIARNYMTSNFHINIRKISLLYQVSSFYLKVRLLSFLPLPGWSYSKYYNLFAYLRWIWYRRKLTIIFKIMLLTFLNGIIISQGLGIIRIMVNRRRFYSNLWGGFYWTQLPQLA